jgi:hypothetical protein
MTVRECIRRYAEAKAREVESAGEAIERRFRERLQQMEDQLIGSSEEKL